MSGRTSTYAAECALKRAVRAAEANGYRVTGTEIQSDGTVCVNVEQIEPTRYVYFIQAEKSWHVKIGISTHIGRRLNALQTANPEKLDLIAKFVGTAADEAAIHQILAEYRLSGEWFAFGPWLKTIQRGVESGAKCNTVIQWLGRLKQ